MVLNGDSGNTNAKLVHTTLYIFSYIYTQTYHYNYTVITYYINSKLYMPLSLDLQLAIVKEDDQQTSQICGICGMWDVLF